MGKLYPISIILVLTLFFSSCQDNSTSINQKTKEDNEQIKTPSVEGKSLVFDSSNDFKGFVQNLQQKSYGELDKFVNQKAHGFTSLKMAQEHIRKKKSKSNSLTTQEEKTMHLNVEDPAFASILNKDGVFQVGKQIFKITNKYTYIFKDKGAYQNFQPSKKKSSNPSLSYVKPCEEIRQEPIRIRQDVYRVENCGGGGGGSYDPGDDDDEYTDPSDLDPYANLSKKYPSKITQEYRSGGTKGRLKGQTWHRDFFVYESIGVKSVHERHTWLRWWNRKAEKITIASFAKFSYGEVKISFLDLKNSFTVKLRDVISTIQSYPANPVTNLLNDIEQMSSNSKLTRYGYDALNSLQVKIEITKNKTRGEEVFTYDIAPKNIQETYSKVKYNAKKIRHVYDWSTAVISYPPNIKDVVDFEIDQIRSKHTLKHDGYHFGFITEERY
ncbi:hypothetical protein [Fodinibius halophilus]|uniref:Lipoprotein n=1 Tax=Fodinibius halophilus TaxID=1736908 RepID=A0A6M1T2N1_9BACT|nr:hypothetical protein [Fodinibius halophilus]NGP88289.1 hypothetical protein [Fodinibius halophilus]